MTRKKVKLQLIQNDSERKASFRKRKKGLMKKVHELSVLCGVEACAVIYSPYEAEPDVWPSQLGVHELLEKFRNLPEADKGRKMFDQETYTLERIKKLLEQAEKLRKENERKEAEYFMYSCMHGHTKLENLEENTLSRVRSTIDDFIRDIDIRLDITVHEENSLPPAAAPPAVAPPPQYNPVSMEEIFPDLDEMNIDENFQWFLDAIETPAPFSPWDHFGGGDDNNMDGGAGPSFRN